MASKHVFHANVARPSKADPSRIETVKVEVTIDVDEVVRTLCWKASRNRSGRAVAGGGMVIAKVVKARR